MNSPPSYNNPNTASDSERVYFGYEDEQVKLHYAGNQIPDEILPECYHQVCHEAAVAVHAQQQQQQQPPPTPFMQHPPPFVTPDSSSSPSSSSASAPGSVPYQSGLGLTDSQLLNYRITQIYAQSHTLESRLCELDHSLQNILAVLVASQEIVADKKTKEMVARIREATTGNNNNNNNNNDSSGYSSINKEVSGNKGSERVDRQERHRASAAATTAAARLQATNNFLLHRDNVSGFLMAMVLVFAVQLLVIPVKAVAVAGAKAAQAA
ncbi:hypothetical protein QBC44DRAFT_393691 [Cladorrhinum sp. PSN332]|nr:hypothetical protein QBC44DRAFT_393691 [Cladorrhinum sp. PSN332]